MEPGSTSLAAGSLKAAAGPVSSIVTRYGPEAYAKITYKFEKCFQGHVDATYKRCSKMKNILYRDNAVDFLSQYVNINFSADKDIITDFNVVSDSIRSKKVLITGTAGAGKTMFLRWASLKLIGEIKKTGLFPLYLEMRYFQTKFSSEPIERYIYESTSAEKDKASFEQFKEGLKSGLFVIVLDAIDEVSPDIRPTVINNIIDFVRSYPLCGMIISSRYDEKLESVQEFSVLRTTPMNEAQIICVIKNLDYDHEVKSKLIERLRGGLYRDLSEFLSNPLLATIMLLTFDHSADIPTKLTSFYQQAFEALYQRHDAAKGAYKRNQYAGMPMDRFQSIFSTFSFQTYLNYKFEFSDTELLDAFTQACEYLGESVDANLLIKDTMESVCLIQREGLDNVFAHRSFQEYFCALFISKFREEDSKTLVDALASMENRSTVMRMLVELAPELFEYEWLLPILEDMNSKTARIKLRTKTGLKRFFKLYYANMGVEIESGELRTVSWSPQALPNMPFGQLMSVIGNAYQQHPTLYESVFASPVWQKNVDFAFIPSDVRPSKSYISSISEAEHTADTSPKIVRLSPSDADWLIYTDLPLIFEKMRTNVSNMLKDLSTRRQARRVAVANLLQKPNRRSRTN